MGPHLASGLQGVNLAPVWGVGVRGGLGTSFQRPGGLGTMGPLWEEWSAGRLLALAVHHHSRTSPNAAGPPLCSLSPRYRQQQRNPPSPLTSPAWSKL